MKDRFSGRLRLRCKVENIKSALSYCASTEPHVEQEHFADGAFTTETAKGGTISTPVNALLICGQYTQLWNGFLPAPFPEPFSIQIDTSAQVTYRMLTFFIRQEQCEPLQRWNSEHSTVVNRWWTNVTKLIHAVIPLHHAASNKVMFAGEGVSFTYLAS